MVTLMIPVSVNVVIWFAVCMCVCVCHSQFKKELEQASGYIRQYIYLQVHVDVTSCLVIHTMFKRVYNYKSLTTLL